MIFENIKELTKENTNFRHVIYTGNHSQLVLMSLLPKEDIGEETHEDNDQILFIVSGEGEAILNGKMTKIGKKSVVFVPSGTKHNIINTGDEDMKLYTVYAPSVHKDGIIHITKLDAEKEWE
ncbi:MAG TPA: cupin domain-containing protein [Patescibacteria group bacterium]